jgi:predicted ATPase
MSSNQWRKSELASSEQDCKNSPILKSPLSRIVVLKISRLEIIGLFGHLDIKIPISNNRIIITGLNGVGKSTTINCLYYFISSQWNKLNEVEFERISVWIGRDRFSFTSNEIADYCDRPGRQNMPSLWRHRVDRAVPHVSSDLVQRILDRSQPASKLRAELAIALIDVDPTVSDRNTHTYLRAIRDYFSESLGPETFTKFRETEEYFREKIGGKILYLPTYRRIERDLGAIFPELREEIIKTAETRSRQKVTSNSYVELINFGMSDVREKIDSKLLKLEREALSQMNSLSTRYLLDVVRKRGTTYDPDTVKEINPDDIGRLIDTGENQLFEAADRQEIFRIVGKIHDNFELEDNEKYVAHYISYLFEIWSTLSEKEEVLERFSDLCNRYLFEKRMVFDKGNYSINIENMNGAPIRMAHLSSGEKQIVSLFSHLLLDEEEENYIIIDEPELSLSVEWQLRFLEDVSKMPSSVFIGVVTHSPFIFENSLDKFAVDLAELTRVQQG